MPEKTFYIALIECNNDQWNIETAKKLSDTMKDLKTQVDTKGCLEYYRVSNPAAFLRFREEIRRNKH